MKDTDKLDLVKVRAILLIPGEPDKETIASVSRTMAVRMGLPIIKGDA